MASNTKNRDSVFKHSNLFLSILRWLFFPRRQPVFTEPVRKSKRQKRQTIKNIRKGKKIEAAQSARSMNVPATTNVVNVDRKGRVTFSGSDRVLFKAGAEQRKNAVQQAMDHFADLQTQRKAFEQVLLTQGLSQENYDRYLALAKTYQLAQGLPKDMTALAEEDKAHEALAATVSNMLETNRKVCQEIILTLEGQKNAPFNKIDEMLELAKERWKNAPMVEAVHLTSMRTRFENAQNAGKMRLKMAQQNPQQLLADRADLLDVYAELLAEDQPTSNMRKALRALNDLWAATCGLEQILVMPSELLDRYQRQEKSQNAAQQTLETEAQKTDTVNSERAEMARIKLTHMISEMERDDSTTMDVKAVENELRNIIADINLASLDDDKRMILKAQSFWESLRLEQKAATQRKAEKTQQLIKCAEAILRKLEQFIPSVAIERNWAVWQAQKDTQTNELDQILEQLPKFETKELLDRLKQSNLDWHQKRAAFFEELDQSREQAEIKKSALIDRLTHYPEGLSAKQLDVLLSDSLAQWKSIGAAERTREEELWQEFIEVRQAIAGERDGIRSVEQGDWAYNMSAAFIRKKQHLGWLEWLVNHERYLARQKDKPELRDQCSAKEKEIERLRGQLFDIQRKLNKVSTIQRYQKKCDYTIS